MSAISSSSQGSHSVEARLGKLQTLHQVLTKDKSDKKISKAFTSLEKIDRDAIRQKIVIKDVGSTIVKQKKKLISVVKGQIKKLFQAKTDSVFRAHGAKGSVAINYFPRVPKDVLTTVMNSFLEPKDLANFRTTCKEASKLRGASLIIKRDHLEGLTETYLHRSCSALNETAKIAALHELMSMAYRLSKIEKLSRPSYSSLVVFFEEIEARNLIRMMGKIHQVHALPDLPKDIESLKVPKNSEGTQKKAERLRGWLEQRQEFLVEFNNKLDLSDCELSLLPKEIGQLQALQMLDLDNNRLTSLPKEIIQLQALQGLWLSNNHLANLPTEIGRLQALQGLWLSNNHLASLPAEIGRLQALQRLHLDNNHLASLSTEVGRLQALEKLSLRNNHLTSLPKEISQIQALQELGLSKNCLASLPAEIGQLQALQTLFLDNNHLVSLPKEIGQLQALQTLDLDNNYLASLPTEIGQLRALQELRLENNRLASLPKEIGQLQALQEIWLSNNHLASLPKEMGQLQILQWLELKQNGLIDIAASVQARYQVNLKEQNKQLQLKTIFGELSLCVTGGHDTKRIADLLNTIERLLGKEVRSQLHGCMYEVAQKTAKSDKSLGGKLKDQHFARKAFVDPTINPKLKTAAIELFRKKFEKQTSAKK